MFLHLYTNRLRCLLKDKVLLFWTLAFPLLLSTLFSIAFSNISEVSNLSTISVAVVEDSNLEKNESLNVLLTELTQGENPIFNLNRTSKEKALMALENNEVSGIIEVKEDILLTLKSSGFEQTIIKSILDNYIQTYASASKIILSNPSALESGLARSLYSQTSWVEEIPVSENASPNTVLISYYALIAMSCLYGSFWGLNDAIHIQGDLSVQGARVNLSPIPKPKLFISYTLASLTLHFSEILILLAYLSFVFNIDFGSRIGLIILNCFLGSLVGLSFGTCVTVLVKKSDGIKTGILITSSMLMSFLAGLMSPDIKYIVDKSAPLLSALNPVNAITNGFYALYFYSDTQEFWKSSLILLLLTLIFFGITWFEVRREKYASL